MTRFSGSRPRPVARGESPTGNLRAHGHALAGPPRAAGVPAYTPRFGREEIDLAQAAIRGGWVTSDGPYVREFERRFGRFIGARHAIATTNGTAALHLALVALGIGPNDEVIIPDSTMVACLDAVLYTGATPVMVDVDSETWTMEPHQVEAAVGPRTRAIMPVHTYGHPADMDSLRRIGRRHRLAIVEDAAEAHGSEYRGHRVGALGTVGCFSFYASKILSTGEGGMVVTNDTRLAARTERLHELAYASEDRNYRHTEVGFNYRLTDVQAAIGLAQLARLPRFIRHRRACAALYSELLADVESLTPQSEAPWARSAYWAYTVLVGGRKVRRERLIRDLWRQGIHARVAFWPMHRQPFAPTAGWQGRRFPVADRIGRCGVSLPFGNGISFSTVRRVAEVVRRSLRAV